SGRFAEKLAAGESRIEIVNVFDKLRIHIHRVSSKERLNEIPNPKTQIPNNSQAPNSKSRGAPPSLAFEIWDLFGIWVLGIGFFIVIWLTPHPGSSLRWQQSSRPPARRTAVFRRVWIRPR